MRLCSLLICCLMMWCNSAFSQKFDVRDFSVGYRIGECNSFGNNPLIIPALLKKPVSYQNFLNGLQYNALYGSPGPLTFHRVFFNAELTKKGSANLFWRKTSIPIGINFTLVETKRGMGIEKNEWYSGNTDSTIEVKLLSLVQKQSFIGLHTGLTRRVPVFKKVSLITGLWLQGEIAVRHYFEQRLDTSSYQNTFPRKLTYHNTQNLPRLKGRNYSQWSLLFPLAAEIPVYKKAIILKPEITVGVQGNRYLQKNFASRESINAALWLIYRKT